ncbi:hypothetical protein ACWCPM_03120 [Streptomyces sp. NPDC002309]
MTRTDVAVTGLSPVDRDLGPPRPVTATRPSPTGDRDPALPDR